MKVVKPILKDTTIYDIESYLKDKNERDYILFLCGITLGLRISDLLDIKVKDILNKDIIYIKEKKTGKVKEIAISKKLKSELRKYYKDTPKEEYLFKSRNGRNKPIGRDRAYRIIKEAGEKFGLNRIGTHSLRKTFGRKYYQKYAAPKNNEKNVETSPRVCP